MGGVADGVLRDTGGGKNQNELVGAAEKLDPKRRERPGTEQNPAGDALGKLGTRMGTGGHAGTSWAVISE